MSDVVGPPPRAGWFPDLAAAGPESSPGCIQPVMARGGAPEVQGDMSVADGDLLRRYIARHGEIPLSTRDVIEWWLESKL